MAEFFYEMGGKPLSLACYAKTPLPRQAMGCSPSKKVQPTEKASSKAAPPDFKELIEKNLVLPDELEGPYLIKRYHSNWRGTNRGFFDNPGGQKKWLDSNAEKMKTWTSWGAIDWDHPDAPDPDFALAYGAINGEGLDMKELRPVSYTHLTLPTILLV